MWRARESSRTTNCSLLLLNREWRIYTGHQLEWRGVFHVNEVPRGSTQLLILALHVCVRAREFVWLSVASLRGNILKVSQTHKQIKPYAKSVSDSMHKCEFSQMCPDYGMRSLFKKWRQRHTRTKHTCGLFFGITKVENQFSFQTAPQQTPSVARLTIIIITVIKIIMAEVMIR